MGKSKPNKTFAFAYTYYGSLERTRFARRVIVIPRVALRLTVASVVIRARPGVATYREAKSSRN